MLNICSIIHSNKIQYRNIYKINNGYKQIIFNFSESLLKFFTHCLISHYTINLIIAY